MIENNKGCGPCGFFFFFFFEGGACGVKVEG